MIKVRHLPKLDPNTNNFWDVVLVVNKIIDYVEMLEEKNETTNQETKGE